MAYIRTKKINNKSYAYLVESKNTPSGPRQKVKFYLGRVHEFEKLKNVDLSENHPRLLPKMIITQLKQIGFKNQKNQKEQYVLNNLIFSPNNHSLTKKTKSNFKEAVIALNGGHLCTFTLQRIANFKKTNDFNQDAYKLAKYFLEAGLTISKEEFINFYHNLK